MGIEGIEDIILGFCGWEEDIWKWLGESIDRRWREQSMEFLRGGKWWDEDPNIIENMCQFAEKIFRPDNFTEMEIRKEQKSSDLCLGKRDFQSVCEKTLRETSEGMIFTKEAMHALQVASESMICHKFEDGILRAISRTEGLASAKLNKVLRLGVWETPNLNTFRM